jgi:iron complex transport system ATP-binding protein
MSLDVANLNYSYSSKFSLTDISLRFPNVITAVIGPNGAGKSTLIKCIANILKSSGDIVYMDQKINRKDKSFFAKSLSYLPQYSQNDATITVFEAILLGLMNSLTLHVSPAQREAVNTMLDIFDLQSLAQQRVCELSGGQMQMVLLAQALIKQPEILMLDEPLNNLDIHRQFALLNLISKLSKQKDMITIIVMHDINLAARYADNIVIMNHGKLYSQGKPQEVITPKTLKDIYKIESNIHINREGYPVIEFVDIAANF